MQCAQYARNMHAIQAELSKRNRYLLLIIAFIAINAIIIVNIAIIAIIAIT